MTAPYVHGYQPRENERLKEQASTLEDLLHGGTTYPAGSRVLEVGCGIGAQTVALATRSPGARFVSIDRQAESVAQARLAAQAAGLDNVECLQADVLALPFEAASFDHVFVCFVLEHLADPGAALARLRRLLKPGGTATVIEGDHGSVLFHPENAAARDAIACQAELQRRAGGDAFIGRRLRPLLTGAGFEAVRVSALPVQADADRPDLVDGFTRKSFIPMIDGVREQAVAAGLTSLQRFDAGIQGLNETTRPDGMFLYTFFKAVGRLPTATDDLPG